MPFLPVGDDNPLRLVRFQVVTALLIAANVAVWLGQQALSEDELWFAYIGYGLIPAVFTGEVPLPPELARIPAWQTLFTSMFVHSGFWHLGGNMLFLWVFGDNVEDAAGHLRFLALYVACGVLGGLVEVAMAPGSTTPVVGASAAVAGVLGAYLMLHPRRRMLVVVARVVPIRLHVGVVLVTWIAYQLGGAVLVGGAPDNDVAWWAHVGGFLAGMALIVPLRGRGVPLFDRPPPIP